MNTYDIVRVILNVIHAGILLISIPRISRLLRRKREYAVPIAFCLFGYVTLFMSILYWMAYSMIYPEVRMPFAANEFGEGALFLLFSAVLSSLYHNVIKRTLGAVLLTIIFSIANIALWIAWSGEWADDVITGICFGYFLCVTVRSLMQVNAMDGKTWRIIGIYAAVLILMQTSIFFVPDVIGKLIDTICYVSMFASVCFLVVQLIKVRENRDAFLVMSFAYFAWTLVVMYMCAEPMYFAADVLEQAGLVLIYQGLRRRVEDL